MKNPGTAVTFYKRADGALVGFRAQGHSGYAQAGEDIVCAGISALTQTTLNGLVNVARVPVTHRQDDRTALLEANIGPDANEKQLEQAQLLLETLLQGLQAIERSYPRNVRIFFEERR
ncbi:MAG: ribosomal-processing cysteine protease Prp [Clostridia bacterium]|nr:ribosomal-processing cysteine protease Prp [Clostridia bacterium]